LILDSKVQINVSLIKNNSGVMYAGGVLGYSNAKRKIQGVDLSDGTVTMARGVYDGKNYAGGIAGLLSAASLTDCSFNGKLNIPVTHVGTNSTTNAGINYIGGVVGSYTLVAGTVAQSCSFTGEISYEGKSKGEIQMGGVAGYLNGGGRVDGCYSSGSDIIINDPVSTNDLYVGGFAGYMGSGTTIVNCYASAGLVEAAKTGEQAGILVLGGFAGDMFTQTLENCWSSSLVRVPSGHTGTGNVYLGGFMGDFNSGGDIKNCHATGDVQSYTAKSARAGGLVGYARNQSDNPNALRSIYRCYAAGDVYIANGTAGGLAGGVSKMIVSECYAAGQVRVQSGSVYAGGLIGDCTNSTIKNSYALGNVSVDAGTNTVYAGGLTGTATGSSSVQYNFSAGSVSAQRLTGTVYAGGIAGITSAGTLSNNAAGAGTTGVGITALGAPRNIGRIAGSGTSSAGYALATMRLESDTYANRYNPAVIAATPNVNGLDGANAAASAFRTEGFWTTTADSGLGFNSAAAGTGVWSFSRVSTNGYPVHANRIGAP
jgi:hypothetical protein